MTIEIKHHLWSDKALIAIANAMSEDIDQASIDTSELAQHEREKIMIDLTRAFDGVCAMLEERGVTISDHVVCPKEW